MNKPSDVLVIVPTYNEKENIKKLIPALKALNMDPDVLVVDDNSPDGTAQCVEAFQEHYERVYLLKRSGKLGLGTAYKAGFDFGLKQDYAYLLTMDADFSHDPSSIPQLLEGMKQADVMIGSKYVKGGVLEGPFYRRLLSRTANLITRKLLGLKTMDNTAGFRCYKRTVIESVNYSGIRSSGYSFLVEMAYRCGKRGFRVGETPIVFNDRKAGKSKISQKEILRAIATLLRLRFSGEE